jgi:adenylate cyclase class IV
MQITTFNPQIVTQDAEAAAALFEELGFERRHDREEVGELGVRGIRMKNADGFYLDISQPPGLELPDMVAIRINVRDFDEAFELLRARGFENVYGDGRVETESSRSAFLISPTGFGVNLIEHIRR